MNIVEILADLEAKAKQATNMDWSQDGRRIFNEKGTIAECPTPQHGGTFDAEQNATYIVACSPARILALVAYVRGLRQLEEAAKAWDGEPHYGHYDLVQGAYDHPVTIGLREAIHALAGHLDAGRGPDAKD